LIGTADAFVVTAESLSMVSEALATGKPVALYDFHGAMDRHPLHGVFAELQNRGKISSFDSTKDIVSLGEREPYDEVPQLSKNIKVKLGM
jgi:mitochondrial fission protein ELM1